MDLTPKNKAAIDSKGYESLLHGWRFSPVDSPWLQGETGAYWQARMIELRLQPGGDEIHVAASKSIGWE
jgi:hypothetical protein